MTPGTVATMAGRELDKLVAERVFGISPRMVRAKGSTNTFEVQTDNAYCQDGQCDERELSIYFQALEYSTDPAAFFALLERVRELGLYVETDQSRDGAWIVRLQPWGGDVTAEARGATLPLAFARAAVAAMMDTPLGGPTA